MKPIGILTVLLLTCLAPLDRLQAETFTTVDAPGAGSRAGQGTVIIGMDQDHSLVGRYIDAQNAHHRFVRDRRGTFATLDPAGSSAPNGQPKAAETAAQPAGNTRRVSSGCMATKSSPASPRGGEVGPVQIVAGMGTSYGLSPGGPFAGPREDERNLFHGNSQDANGTTSEFDAPGAGTGESQGTFICSVNPDGAVVGHFIDRDNVLHGYVRAAGGSFTTYDAPNAGTSVGQGTVIMGTTSAGIMIGYYIDADGVAHGFQRTRTGRVIAVDVPLAGSAAGQGTFVVSINAAGVMMGYYVDENGVSHGFLWER